MRDAARDLAEIGSRLRALKGDANAYLIDPNYGKYCLIRSAAAAGSSAGRSAGTPRRSPRTDGTTSAPRS